MIKILRTLVALCAVFSASGVAVGNVPAPQFGPRPANSIHDPFGVLSTGWTNEIAAKLPQYREQDGVDIVVVILNDLGNAPPEHVAALYARAWCEETPLHGVILHVTDRPDSPWLHVGGQNHRALSNPLAARADIESARRRASREPDDSRKVRAAVTETADLLRIWMGVARQRTELILRERERQYEAYLKRQQLRRLVLPVLMLGIVGSLILLLWVVPRRLRREPCMFAPIHPKPRLGAPHAGGNNAFIGRNCG